MIRGILKIIAMIAAAIPALCATGFAQTQDKLDDSCTVSVLNRTVRVNPDGSWVLPNIPANFGQVKARATCVRDAITSFGESDFFTVPVNGTANLPAITLGSSTPIPISLGMTPPTLSFTAAGQTAQLVVTAAYPGGATGNVTASATGTTYQTSNPAIATVDANGLVTAVGSGAVVIQATNDGASRMITANVVLSGNDSDGDGISDDVEISLGLDPHNPLDAQEDFDHDGLTNLQEVLRGTGLRNPDSDGDGLTDGDEVSRNTNPLLRDTDSDLVPDGVEVQTGTNPLDPASFNFAAALRSIAVTPTSVALVVNTITGEAFRQLTVTGTFIDDSAVNLTSRSRGTNYISSNVAVANFGATDGLVFAGANGTATITVTNSGHSAAAQVTVSSFTPTALSFVAIPGYANNVDVSGDYAYVAAGATGLQVVSVGDRSAPVIAGSLDTPGNANDVRVVGNRVYIAAGSAGLQIIDVTTPAAPVLLGALDTPGEANDVIVVGNRAYVADGPAGLQIIDVSNPQAPSILGTIDTPGVARGVDVSGNIAVVADGSGVRTIDVSNPAAPVILGSIATTDARDVTVDGNIAYLADFSGSLRVINFSNPAAPQLLATTPQSSGGILTDVAKVRDFVFGSDVFFVNGVPITDVSNPATPTLRARLDFPARDDNGTGIAVDNSYVYLTADHGIQENGVTGDSRLYIGQYFSLEDRAGIPPVVTITSPATGASVIEGSTIPITVQATDDVQVATVDFLVNGDVVFTDSLFPYQFNFTVPVGITSLTLGATAADLGGNVGAANNVTINVIPDPLTTVVGRVLDSSLNPVEGAVVKINQLSTTTGADGAFTIAGAPTITGNIVVEASATIGGVFMAGKSASVAPVVGGTTSVGDILIHHSRVAVFTLGRNGISELSSLDIRNKLQGTGLFTQVDTFILQAGDPAPTLSQLRQYDAVLVYNIGIGAVDGVSLGNVLADYMDGGGGVVVAGNSFFPINVDGSNTIGLSGRIFTAGYLPLSLASSFTQGHQTLVPIDPQHEILDGVTSFDGGASSRRGFLVTTPSATLIARWSDGLPLVATKIPTTGRIVGLNFFPPSSDVFPDFWLSSTDGARLMANALIWAMSH